jgi:hypothetical protein
MIYDPKDLQGHLGLEQNIVNNLYLGESSTIDFQVVEEREPQAPGDAGFKDADLNVTQTIDPTRPRTWAAGYDYDVKSENGTLTVVFRDDNGGTGVWWNYYDVPYQIWEEFRNATSKGRYLKASGLDNWHNMGPADPSMLGGFRASQLNSIVRGARNRQAAFKGKMGHTHKASDTLLNIIQKPKGFGKAF